MRHYEELAFSAPADCEDAQVLMQKDMRHARSCREKEEDITGRRVMGRTSFLAQEDRTMVLAFASCEKFAELVEELIAVLASCANKHRFPDAPYLIVREMWLRHDDDTDGTK